MKRLITLLMLAAVPASAAPPNNAFASRIDLGTSASVSTTGTNVDASEQTGEDTLGDLMGSTVWWKWKAPANGWVRIDTVGSAIDTVLRIGTGTSIAGTLVGYNDDWIVTDYRIPRSGASGLTFIATANTEYNICVGGFIFDVDAEEGNLGLNITTGAAAEPANWPSALAFTPASAAVNNTTSANVTASLSVAGAAGSGGATFFMIRPGEEDIVFPDEISGSTWTSGGAALPWVFTIPPYSLPGAWLPLVELETASGEFLEFGTATSGAAYLLPVPGIAQSLTVTNPGSKDTTPPDLTNFGAIPAAVNVNAAPAIIPLSATVTDGRAGVDEVQATLYHPTNPDLDLTVDLTRTAGTPLNGTWTGSLTIPKEYPSGTYAVEIYVHDAALWEITFGADGDENMPGGNRSVAVTGGGPYWEWAYTQVFPTSESVGHDEDPNHDGVDNLNCYAFGLDPVGSTSRSGLPSVLLSEFAPKRLEVGYRKRVSASSGLTYTVEFANNLWDWTPATGVPLVTNLDAVWNHVLIADTETTVSEPRRYARVKVAYVDP